MRQFYQTYKDDPISQPVAGQISWTNNVMILNRAKTIEEKKFYLAAIDEKLKLNHENPSVGLILCKTKSDEIVRIAVSKSGSTMKVATYEIIDQKLLERKIHSLPLPTSKEE